MLLAFQIFVKKIISAFGGLGGYILMGEKMRPLLLLAFFSL